MSITETAREFFEACETGRGWAECAQYCHDGATFSCQADALAEIGTLEGYTDWLQGLLTPIPDGRYELKSFSADEGRAVVTAFAVFKGTQTGPGPVDPPTGKSVATDYVYAMEFDGDRIRHMTKIWYDVQSLRELGWA
jgi:predicted ester cyclase